MRTSRLPAGDVMLEVLQAGIGGRPLLLVHGFTGAKEDFAEVIDDLGERGWHAVAPDLRGHGHSDAPDHPDFYSISVFVEDLVALADGFGWEQFAVLGHSMGGAVAQHLALLAPDRVDALVLMDTTHRTFDVVDAEQVHRAQMLVAEGGMELLLEIQRNRSDALGTAAHRRLLDERPGYREFGDRKLLNAAPAMYVALLAEIALHRRDVLEDLRQVDVPALVLVGEQDEPFVGPSQAMAAALPDARLVVIPDAGHSPQFENPTVWTAALHEFLDELMLRDD